MNLSSRQINIFSVFGTFVFFALTIASVALLYPKSETDDVSVASGYRLDLSYLNPSAESLPINSTVEIGVFTNILESSAGSIRTAELIVNFDKNILTGLSVQESSGLLAVNKNIDNNTGVITIDISNSTEANLANNLKLVTLTFTVKQIAASTNITLSNQSTLGIPNYLDFASSINSVRIDITKSSSSSISSSANSSSSQNSTLSCKGDFNGNGNIDIEDFSTFAASYKQNGISCNLDLVGNNCYLDIADFGEFAKGYKISGYCPDPIPTPEATSNGFSIRNDGVILKNNTPFFPFGFYYEAEAGQRYGQLMANDYNTIGQAGFNTIIGEVTGPNSEQDTQLARQKANELGVSIIASYYKPSYKLWLDRLKTDNSIMGWNTNDDFNSPYADPKTDPTEALAEPQRIDSYSSQIGYKTFTYGSGGGYPYNQTQIPYLFGAYKDVTDIVGVQSYPISNNDGSFANAPLEENFAYLKYAKEQMPENKPVIANLQSFAWSGGRYPDESETRNMVYAALINRMEGIVAYAFNEESGKLDTTKPNLWTEWKKLRQDISGRFLSAVLNGEYKYYSTPNSQFGKAKIHAATFKYTDPADSKIYVYVLAINSSSTQELSAMDFIELPIASAAYLSQPLFPNDNRYGNHMTISVKSDKSYFNGSIPAGGVEAYILSPAN